MHPRQRPGGPCWPGLGQSTAGRAWATPRARRPDNAGTSSPEEAKGQREARAASAATDAEGLPAEPRGSRDTRHGSHLLGEKESSSLFQTQSLSIVSPAPGPCSPRPDRERASRAGGRPLRRGGEALARPHAHLLQELEAWTMDFTLPTTVWLAGFFNPQSFLTAIMQSMARKNEWPLDKMCLSVEVTKKNREDMTAPPREGSYVYGLFMEGNRHWQGKHQGHVGSQWPEEPNHTPASAWLCCGAGSSADLSPHFEAMRSSALEPRTGIRSGGEGPGAHLCQGYRPTTAPPQGTGSGAGRPGRPPPLSRAQCEAITWPGPSSGGGARLALIQFRPRHPCPAPGKVRQDQLADPL